MAKEISLYSPLFKSMTEILRYKPDHNVVLGGCNLNVGWLCSIKAINLPT